MLQAILRLRLFCNNGLVEKMSVGLMDGSQSENCGVQLELSPASGVSGRGLCVCISCSQTGPMNPGMQCAGAGNERRASLQCWERPNEQGAGVGCGGMLTQSRCVSEGKRHGSKIRVLLEDIQNNPRNEKRLVPKIPLSDDA